MEVQLTRDELEQLRQFAEDNGMSLEEAATEAAQSELARRYLVRKLDGEVVPIQGLNGADL